MKIKNIQVNNFRSIEKIDLNLGDFCVFVGQNNHGKTNFFEAIDWFYSPKGSIADIKRKGAKEEEAVEVMVTFTGVQEGIGRMKSEKNKATLEKILKKDEVKIKRSSNAKSRSIFDEEKQEWTEKLPTGFDNSLNDLLPKIEYVKTETSLKDIIKYGKNTPIAEMLAGVLEIILEEDENYRKFKEQFDKLFRDDNSKVKAQLDALSQEVRLYLVKQFAECSKVEFRVNDPAFEDLLKNFETKVDDGVETSAEEKGDGMQRALMLAIIQVYADFRKNKGDKAKNFIFLIDEGELHLHPTAQRKLKNALSDLSKKGDQVLLNTHSSVLVTDDDDTQLIFKVEKSNKITSIKKAEKNERPYLIYELLGGSPADLLLPKNFLIVEGRSDLIFIQTIINRFYSSEVDIQIIYAEGDYENQRKSMYGINTVLVPLYISPLYKERLVILCETPADYKKDGFDSFKRDYKRLVDCGQLLTLSEKSLEEYYPNPWKKTEDEVKNMTSEDKIKLAKKVAEEIKQEQFESDMAVIHSALSKCWSLAYK